MRGTTAFVLAGGSSPGFSVLTHNRAKSALPVCGHFRVIDFVLSNLSLSGVNSVGVIIQYLPGSLIDHIGIGQAYDFDASNKHFKLMPPFIGTGQTNWFRGSADAIAQNLNFLHDNGSDLVLVLSGDHVYSMDYAPLIAEHRRRNADLTIVTTDRPEHIDPRTFGYVSIGPDGRVTGFAEKPKDPPDDPISNGIYLFDAKVLCQYLENLDDSERGHNLPVDVITPLVREGRVFSSRFEGPWSYLRDIPCYIRLHQSILSGEQALHPPDWPTLTNLRDRELGSRPSPYFGRLSEVHASLISPGCVIEGTVVRSVLSPGCYVAPNAVVSDSILFHDTQVLEGASLHGVFSDKDVTFHPYCTVGHEGPDACVLPSHMTIVGKGAQIIQGVRLPAATTVPINQVVQRQWAEEHRPIGAGVGPGGR